MTSHPNVDIGTLPSDRVFQQLNTLSSGGDKYKFKHTGGNINLVVTNVLGGNLNVTLFRDIDKSGDLSQPDINAGGIHSKIGSGTKDAVIFTGNTQAQAGTYFAVVNGSVSPGSSSVNYRFLGSNTGTNESNIMGASAKVTNNADFQFSPLSDLRTSDFYEFHGLANVPAHVTITPLSGQVKGRVIQDVDHNHIVSAKDTIKFAGVLSKATKIDLSPGQDYFVQVAQPANFAGKSIPTDVKFQYGS